MMIKIFKIHSVILTKIIMIKWKFTVIFLSEYIGTLIKDIINHTEIL